MKNVLESAMKAELATLFVSCQYGVDLIIELEEMIHQQPPPPFVTYSATGAGFVNDNTRQFKYKAIDTRLYWIY